MKSSCFHLRSTLAPIAGLAFALCTCTNADAVDHTISGSVTGLAGNGLHLQLVTSLSCLADDMTFTLHSTDTNDCFTPANVSQCCSNSIKATAFDGISTVTCTCGVIIIPIIPKSNETTTATQTINVLHGATSFAFPSPVPDHSNYTVTVSTQPTSPPQVCTITHASGITNGQNVSNVAVACPDRIFRNGFDPTG